MARVRSPEVADPIQPARREYNHRVSLGIVALPLLASSTRVFRLEVYAIRQWDYLGIQFYLHLVIQSHRREHLGSGTDARVRESIRKFCEIYMDLASFDDVACVYRYCC